MRHHHGPGCGHLEKLLYSRRELLGRLGGGVAGLAFADLLGGGLNGPLGAQVPRNPLAPRVPPLVAKAMEGVTKQATGERIRVAVASQAKRLEQARTLLAPSPSVAELTSGADALAVGVPAPMLKQIRAAWPAPQSVVMPLDVMTELVARGVPAEHALEQITALMQRGATPSQIASLGASVQSDVAAGLAPDAALEVRARGVMSLLPSPAAAAALAPSGRRP